MWLDLWGASQLANLTIVCVQGCPLAKEVKVGPCEVVAGTPSAVGLLGPLGLVMAQALANSAFSVQAKA